MRTSLALFMACAIVAPIFARPAHAATELSCLPARTLVGDNNPAPGNRVVKTYVYHSDSGWLIYHTLESNYIVNRATQYSIIDTSVPGASQQWSGVLERNPSLNMIGEIKIAPNSGQIFYVETIYDKGRGGATIVRTVAQCNPIPGSTTPGVIASSLSAAQVEMTEAQH